MFLTSRCKSSFEAAAPAVVVVEELGMLLAGSASRVLLSSAFVEAVGRTGVAVDYHLLVSRYDKL